MSLTYERLREVLSCNPETGVFVWLQDRNNRRLGLRAGSRHTSGYEVIVIDRKIHWSHRLVWLFIYGKWPVGQLDHINGDRADNRLSNLREATRSQNGANRRISACTASGLKGAYPSSNGRFFSSIRVNKRTIYLGAYGTAQEAHGAYFSAAKKYFGEYARAS